MQTLNSKARDPQRYACIQAEQRELEQQYSTHITMARLCPYCKLRLETLCKGAHGATYRSARNAEKWFSSRLLYSASHNRE